MAYRAFLAVLIALAILLTANEKYLEWKAARAAEEIGSPVSVSSAIEPRTTSGGRAPFTPHRVRVREDIDLLREPRFGASRVEPLSFVPAGVAAQAVAESNGWYLLDTNLVRGWAAVTSVDEP